MDWTVDVNENIWLLRDEGDGGDMGLARDGEGQRNKEGVDRICRNGSEQSQVAHLIEDTTLTRSKKNGSPSCSIIDPHSRIIF